MLHIGQKIQEIFETKGMTVVEFARRINTSRENVYGIFGRKSMDVELLAKISDVLDYNFLQHYLSEKFIGYPELDKVKKQLEVAEKEIEYLKKINRLIEERGHNLNTGE